jgi:hypothetical protein
MSASPTFCNIPLSVSVDPAASQSLISLDWILTSGIPASGSCASGVLTLPSGNTVCSMHMNLSVASGIPYDLILGRDWIFFCRQTLPHASFTLSSGFAHPGQLRVCSPPDSSFPHLLSKVQTRQFLPWMLILLCRWMENRHIVSLPSTTLLRITHVETSSRS